MFLITFIFLFIFSNAHRDTLYRNSCMDDFRDTSTPFILPNPEVSWKLAHYYDCHSEAVWFEFQNPEDNWNKMYFGAGIILAERFSEARIHAMVVGPGLPTPVGDVPVDIPDQILNDPNMSDNVIFLESPQDQSTCSHLCDLTLTSSIVVDGRCGWHEEYSDTTWWWVLDYDEIEIPIGGETYYIVAWEQNFRKVKTVFGMGNWDHDFLTNYADIATNQERNNCPDIDWFDDFHEKNENAERDANLPGDACIPGSPPPNEVIYPGVEEHGHDHGEDADHTHDGEDADHTHDDAETECADDDAAAVEIALMYGVTADGCADFSEFCFYIKDFCPVTCGQCEVAEPADEDGDDVVTQTEYEALLAQIEANQAALDDMSSSALGAAMDIAQWQEDVESCASDILADDDDMRRQLLSHEQEEYDALEAENAKLRAAIKQEFLTKYS